MRVSVLSLALLLLGGSGVVQAKMYKWVDENGQVHFGDSVPEQYLHKAHDEVNERGVVIRHKEAMKTPEELAAERRLEQERKKAELIEKKKKQRDRVLLDTYTTERDLIVARDSRLEAVDSQIKLSQSIIDDSSKKIKSLEKQVAEIKASNRKVPDDLYRRIKREQQQIEVQTRVMSEHKKRRNKIATQFDDYIKRFKVLKEEQRARRERLTKEKMGKSMRTGVKY